MLKVNCKDVFVLFYLAVLFMVTFQLVARLVSYTFMFHQGVLLLSSALLGAGFAVLLSQQGSKYWRDWSGCQLPQVLLASWVGYLVVFFSTQNFGLHLIFLSVLFGTFFLLITQRIYLSPNLFTAVELMGSFLGLIGAVVLSHFILEEWLLVGITVALVGYVLVLTNYQGWQRVCSGILLGVTIFVVYVLASTSITALVTCPDTSATYKIACVPTNDTFELVESIPNVKGRSDVFFNTYSEVPRLSVYNSGLHSGTSLPRDAYPAHVTSFHDVEIPLMAYAPESTVVTAGASTGSNVLTFQTYIENAEVTAVEIDTTINNLYTSKDYVPYLPERDSFRFVYEDARTFFASNDATYDVISLMVESVNSTIIPYVDESTSLTYTTEALRSYLEALDNDGYLLLQQFHAPGDAGAAMINKVLRSLDTALNPAASEHFKENILLYSYGNAQKFLAAVYKPNGFSSADLQTFEAWSTSLTSEERSHNANNTSFEILHLPNGEEEYEPYFDPAMRANLAKNFNTSIISDDKPFRHLVTTLPFPNSYYAMFALALSAMLVLLPSNIKNGISITQAVFAFVLGVTTFGLQYVLYYKTATFLGTSLIFFSVFLLIPLLFSAIGGYISHFLKLWYGFVLLVLTLLSAYMLLSGAAFASSPAVVFGLIAILFIFSGMLFPLLLMQTSHTSNRTILYGLNMCGGGLATFVAITLHAVIGWTYLFGGVVCILVFFFLILYYQLART
jgi:spermidine synthase